MWSSLKNNFIKTFAFFMFSLFFSFFLNERIIMCYSVADRGRTQTQRDTLSRQLYLLKLKTRHMRKYTANRDDRWEHGRNKSVSRYLFQYFSSFASTNQPKQNWTQCMRDTEYQNKTGNPAKTESEGDVMDCWEHRRNQDNQDTKGNRLNKYLSTRNTND